MTSEELDWNKSCKDSIRALDVYGYHVLYKPKYGYSHEHRKVYADHYNVILTTKDIIRHICDNRWCVEWQHLTKGTQADNVSDSVDAGTHRNPSFPGSKNPMARLTDKDVLEIRRLFATGRWTHSELGEEFDIHRVTVLNIVKGQTWKHLLKGDTSQ